MAEARAHAPHPLHDGAEVGLHGPRHPHAERGGRAHVAHHARGADDALGWHTPDVEAVAAQQVPLDQRHPRAKPGRPRRRDEAGGARADHHEVVAGCRRRRPPVGRVHLGDQVGVVDVSGKNFHRWRHHGPQNFPRERSLEGRFSRQVVHHPVRTVSENSGGSPSCSIWRASVS